MRASTSIIFLLPRFDVKFSSENLGEIELTLIDKKNKGDLKSFTGKNISTVIAKAWNHFKKEIQ
jgi:hypothetical protein